MKPKNRISDRWPTNPVRRRAAAAQTLQFVDAMVHVLGCEDSWADLPQELRDMDSHAANIVHDDNGTVK